MAKKTRRHHTPDQKINMLRRHHLEKVPVSEVCESAELQPSVFYGWQKHLFEHGSAVRRVAQADRIEPRAGAAGRGGAPQGPPGAQGRGIAEVTEELVRTKESVGEP